MSKLTLMKLGDDTWAATYNDEEAHNIQGDSIEDKLIQMSQEFLNSRSEMPSYGDTV